MSLSGRPRLWDRPAGVASVGFHLQHLAGVLDRLLTYARGEALSGRQLDALRAEGEPDDALTAAELVAAFARQVDAALAQLRTTDPATLTDARGVGRQQVPSTVVGLLVHAAEHTTRHTGQLLVTARGGRQFDVVTCLDPGPCHPYPGLGWASDAPCGVALSSEALLVRGSGIDLGGRLAGHARASRSPADRRT